MEFWVSIATECTYEKNTINKEVANLNSLRLAWWFIWLCLLHALCSFVSISNDMKWHLFTIFWLLDIGASILAHFFFLTSSLISCGMLYWAAPIAWHFNQWWIKKKWLCVRWESEDKWWYDIIGMFSGMNQKKKEKKFNFNWTDEINQSAHQTSVTSQVTLIISKSTETPNYTRSIRRRMYFIRIA